MKLLLFLENTVVPIIVIDVISRKSDQLLVKKKEKKTIIILAKNVHLPMKPFVISGRNYYNFRKKTLIAFSG